MSSAQEQVSAEPLVVGKLIAREMRGDEHHSFQVKLNAGQYARIAVDQKGIDVVLALSGADGTPLVEVDNNLSGTRGEEIVSLVADVSAAYVLTVSSLQKEASPGRYELRIDELRTATDDDRKRVAAERSYFNATKLLVERTPERQRKAIEQFGEALRLMLAVGDRRGEGMTLANIGMTYNLLDEPQKAFDYLDQALTVWRAIGDRHLEAITLSIKGRAYYARSEPQKALEAYSLALPVLRAIGDQSGEAGTYTQIGIVYRVIGEPQKALDHFELTLPLWRAVGDRRNEATALNNMGTVYNLLGDLPKAVYHFQQALALARSIKDRRIEAAALSNMGTVHNAMNKPREALEYLDQALVIVRERNDRRTEAAILTHTGNAYSALNDRQKAVEYFERGLQLRVAVSDRLGEATTLNHYGRAFDSWGEPQKAFEYYEKALPLWRAVGDRNGEVAALYGMARADSERDELLRASGRTEAALNIINALRTKVASRDLRASYFASLQDIYKLHIDLLMRLHRRQPTAGYDVAALKTYEQARARTLIDMLIEASADVRQGVDPNLVARERALQQSLNAEADRQMRLFGSQNSEAAVAAVRRKIEELVTELGVIEAELKTHSPRYAALTQPKPLGLAEIQTAVTDDSTLLLEYSLGEKRSYLWAVTANSFSSYE
ncbi:MAG TPA: tetratricopeptide repeat protein, partial [Pyrinomonadaceae bacterium]|nr:tetratricopeptide repeat protein [Pyrinomonadaceae bacterium]